MVAGADVTALPVSSLSLQLGTMQYVPVLHPGVVVLQCRSTCRPYSMLLPFC